MIKGTALGSLLLLLPRTVWAHATEQGFVLLLPTDHYIAAGVASVVATVLLLALLPATTSEKLFHGFALFSSKPTHVNGFTGFLSLVVVLALIVFGWLGPTDPLKNLLPLFIWTVFWIGFVALQGLFGDIWHYTNPFAGLFAFLNRDGWYAPFRLPGRFQCWPALLFFLAFAALLLIDLAPADPKRLVAALSLYISLTSIGLLLFGRRWLVQAEFLTVFLRIYRKIGLVARSAGYVSAGLWGWQIMRSPPFSFSAALLTLILLGTGSFDGLNETFWWLAQIGINPLEFPGRSAVIWPNTIGLISVNLGLILIFALTVWLGLVLIRKTADFGIAFRTFAPAILPIALAYHVAHYFTSFLVDSQYVVAALSDPLANGSDLLGLGTFYVTAGFFNTHHSVQVIWLTQAGFVVIGHMLSILLAHGLAVRLFGSNRDATLSQLPMAIFMIAYTLFGLWLLASPKGA